MVVWHREFFLLFDFISVVSPSNCLRRLIQTKEEVQIMKLQLKCKCCGEAANINRTIWANGFSDLAYDDICEWSDFSENPPELEEDHWERAVRVPEIGETRLIKVVFSFSFETGESFKLLFRPAWSFFNGWEEYPEELEQSAIVTCKLTSIKESNEYSAWATVRIEDVIMLKDICKRYPEQYTENRLEDFDVTRVQFEDLQYQNWEYYSWNAQGDCGEWKLIYQDENGIRHLILLGEWSFHGRDVYIGNIVNEK